MDRADVLAENSHGNQLHRAEEENTDHQRRDAYREAIPEQQFVEQVAEPGQNAEGGSGKPGEGHQPQRHLRKIGDAQHRHIVERVKIVLGETPLAARLVEQDRLVRKPDLGDHPAKVWVRVVERLNGLDHAAVEKSEAGEVLESFQGGNPVDQPVVLLADPEHQPVLLAGSLDRQHHGIAFFPFLDKPWDHLRRVLEIGRHAYGGVAADVLDRVHR